MNAIRSTLEQDHHELDELLRRISDDATAPASTPLQSTWSEFESRLASHMAAEERDLLPLVEAAGHPLEVARMRSEHAQVRQLVSVLGVAIDLHAARQPAIEELVALLRAHARREDHVLYEFAGRDAPAAVHDKITHVLRAARQTIAGKPLAAFESHRSTSDK